MAGRVVPGLKRLLPDERISQAQSLRNDWSTRVVGLARCFRKLKKRKRLERREVRRLKVAR